MQQLGGTDAYFLYMETAETPMHVGSVYLYELPPDYPGDFYDNFKAAIAERMHLFPVFTRKLMQLPLDFDAPLWVEDEQVDLDYHIRHLTLPKPGRFDQLEDLVGQLHSNLLDRSRPLWEIYIIDGLGDGRVAEYTKFHHAGFDGAAAMAIVESLYDITPVPRPVPPRSPSSRKPDELDPLRLVGVVYGNALRQYLRSLQAIPDLLKTWGKLSLPDPETLKLEPPELPHLAPSTPLNVSITGQRSYAAQTVSFKTIKTLAKANDATVNDVVLAVCSGALRRYLGENDALPEQSLTAFVPMSVREAGDVKMNIQTIGMICSLATDVADPIKRLHAIHESSQKAKRLTETIRSAMLGILTPWGTPFLVHGMMDLLGRYHLADAAQPLANLTISNIIGPPVTLYLAGAKLVAVYPISIPTHGSALNITVQSYVDDLHMGLVACRRAVPDVRVIGEYMVGALAELGEATAEMVARAAAPPARRARPKARPKKASPARKAARARAPPPETGQRKSKPKETKKVSGRRSGATAKAAEPVRRQ